MTNRRVLGVLASLAVVLFAGALPAQAADKPDYPPNPLIVSVIPQRISVGSTAQVTASVCPYPGTATATATQGSKTTVPSATTNVLSDGTAVWTDFGPFRKPGANTVTVTCGTLTGTVKVNVLPDTAVLGVIIQGSASTQSAATTSGPSLAHTGANLISFLAAGFGMLLAGAALVLASRRRRSARV